MNEILHVLNREVEWVHEGPPHPENRIQIVLSRRRSWDDFSFSPQDASTVALIVDGQILIDRVEFEPYASPGYATRLNPRHIAVRVVRKPDKVRFSLVFIRPDLYPRSEEIGMYPVIEASEMFRAWATDGQEPDTHSE